MSDHIPFEIQEEIIKKLPIKSVIKFRFVSKPWTSLIDSSKFIADYHVHHTETQYLLLYKGIGAYPRTIHYSPKILDSSKALFCSYNSNCIRVTTHDLLLANVYNTLVCYDSVRIPKHAVLWNPSTRKLFTIYLPNVCHSPYRTIFGFGVCPDTGNCKIVNIKIAGSGDSLGGLKVEVYTGVWGSLSVNHPCRLNRHTNSCVLDGISYWLAFDGEVSGYGLDWYDLFMSFDLTSEEFKVSYVMYSDVPSFLSKLKQSNFFLQTDVTKLCVNKKVYGVCMKEHYVPKSFTDQFHISTPDLSIEYVSGYTNSEIIDGMRNGFEHAFQQYALFARRPFSEDINYVRIYGNTYSFFASVCGGQLLLLDH